MMTNAELRQRLSEAPKAYKNFAESIISLVKTWPEVREDLVKYLEDHRDARADEILAFISDKIEF